MERVHEALEVLNPVAQVDVEKVTAASRVTLSGKKIGLCSNRKPGATTALDRVGELLREQFADVTFERFDFFFEFSPEAMQQMADSGCDAIVASSGD